MKYKKYIFFLLLIMILGCNKIYAAECNIENAGNNENDCYYTSSDGQTNLYYNSNKKKVELCTRSGSEVLKGNGDPLINKNSDKKDNQTGILVSKVGTTCPTYIVYRMKDRALWWNSDGIWGFNDINSANTFLSTSNSINNMEAWIVTYKKANGQKITKQEFENQINIVIANSNVESNHSSNQSITNSGENVVVTCDELFGSKNDPNSIKYMINEILQYPRIIVPILVIIFGIIDFGKAVIASKEDEMKKAQSTFIRRVIIGVAIFFVPALVNIIMSLADIVWEGLGYTTCGL